MLPLPRLVLASSSPRRRELLAALGLTPEIVAAGVDETLEPGEDAFRAAERLALAKTAAVAALHPEALVIAADTLVVLDGRALGKPRDGREATEMLSALAGRAHQVVTGVALALSGRTVSGRDTTNVTFAPISAQEIARYVATDEPSDRAGAYAVQGIGGLFVTRVDGSPSNVVGLPVRLVYQLAARLGVDLLDPGTLGDA